MLVFSDAALKCGVRDHWIGWDFRYQYDRLNLLANNSRFLILPDSHYKNSASKVLSLCQRRIQQDWINRFGYPLLLLETFVDPTRFNGTIYKTANWRFAGYSKGYQRIRNEYSNTRKIPKKVFVQPLQRNTCTLLSRPIINKLPYAEYRALFQTLWRHLPVKILVQKLMCLFKCLWSKNLTAMTSGSFPEKSCWSFLSQFL